MQYTVIMVNNHSYDLPPKTIKVVEELERIASIDSKTHLSLRDKFKAVFNSVAGFIGKENAIDLLGSDNFEEVDLNEVTIAYQKIVDAYSRPTEEYKLNETIKAFDNLPIDRMVSLANAADKLKSIE